MKSCGGAHVNRSRQSGFLVYLLIYIFVYRTIYMIGGSVKSKTVPCTAARGVLLHTTSRFVPFLAGSLPRYIVKMGRWRMNRGASYFVFYKTAEATAAD